MWCDNPKCKKEVDINSVAVNKPRGALSMDIEGDVTPTIIHSTSNIINICKSCGESDYLFDSEASARKEDERQMAQWKKPMGLSELKKDLENQRKKEKVWDTGCKISLGVALAFGLWSLKRFPDDDQPVPIFIIFSFFGFIFGLIGTWFVSNATD